MNRSGVLCGLLPAVACVVFARVANADTSTVEIDVLARTFRVVVTGPPDDQMVDSITTEDEDSLGVPSSGLLSASLGALTPWTSTTGFGSTAVIGRSSLQVSTVHSASASNASAPSTFYHEGRVLARWASSAIRFTNADGTPLAASADVTLWCVFKSELAEVGIPVCSSRSVQVSLRATGATNVILSCSLRYTRTQFFCPPFPSSETVTIIPSGIFEGGSSTMNQTVTVPLRFTVEPGRDVLHLDLIAETTLQTDSFGTSDSVSHLLSLESFINVGNSFRPPNSGGAAEGVFEVPAGVTANSSGGRIVNNGYVSEGGSVCAADLVAPFGTLDVFDVIEYLGLFDAQDPAADLAAPAGVFDFFDVVEYLAAFDAGC